MLLTRSSRLTVLGLALFAIACSGTGPKATYVDTAYPFSLYALTGAPANAPTAIAFLGGPTPANAGFAFDIAFDIDQSGTTRLYPVRTLAGGLAASATKRVGLQLLTGTTFEALTQAPATGYDTLGSKVVVPGSVVAAEILDQSTCLYSLNGYTVYAKLTIDSIKTAARRIYGRTVVDPNCGFHELRPDTIPER